MKNYIRHPVRKSIMKFLALLLLPVFCYTTTVKEIHFLFLHHVDEHHDGCHNHLHESHEHEACTFCKIDISVATDAAPELDFNFISNYASAEVILYTSIFVPALQQGYSLRGPPVC